MKFSVLSSSSSGNCIYLESNNKKYLIDAGFSLRQTLLKLDKVGVDLNYLDGIFITHEHSDHVGGLASISSKYNTKIYLTKGTYRGLSERDKEKISPINLVFIKPYEVIELSGLKVTPFSVSHDAKDPVGYLFEENVKSLVYLTDTGCFEPIDLLKDKDAYVMESNHEVDMLQMSSRPWILINRIMSNEGHLSNEDSAKLFSKLYGKKTKNLVLFHLSNECNTKELATLTYKNYFKVNSLELSFNLLASDSKEPLELIEV